MNIKLSNLHEESIFFANKALIWDYVKCKIRGFSLSYSSYKAKQNKQQEKLLKTQLTELEQTISETPTPENLDIYYDIKSTLEALCTDRARGSIIRSRVQHISEDEKKKLFELTKAKLQQKMQNKINSKRSF